MKPLVDVRRTARSLWFACAAGPVVWAAHFLASYFLSEKTCKLGPATASWGSVNTSKAVAFSFTLIATGVLVSAMTISIRSWLRVRTTSHESAPPAGRDSFLSVYAIASNALFLLLVLVEGLPNLLLLRVCH